jgi:GTP-binding protein
MSEPTVIRSAEFVKSSSALGQCPAPNLPEFAFIGRSNVGKSSLINMITSRKSLAKTSSTPGKTQVINHFIINNSWYLVDLPGYGFAKISRSQREAWEKMTMDYLTGRTSLISTFVLIDSRIEPQRSDMEFMERLAHAGLPFAMVFTKADKLTKNELASSMAAYKRTMLRSWESMPQHIITSAETGLGREELLEYISSNSVHFGN